MFFQHNLIGFAILTELIILYYICVNHYLCFFYENMLGQKTNDYSAPAFDVELFQENDEIFDEATFCL